MNQENNKFNQNSFNNQPNNLNTNPQSGMNPTMNNNINNQISAQQGVNQINNVPNIQSMSDNLNQNMNTQTQQNIMSQSVQSNPSADLMSQQMNNNIYQQPSIQPENNPNIQNNSMSNQLNNKLIFNNKKLFIIVGIVLVITVGIFIALNINKDKINKGIILSQGGYKCKRADVSTLHTEICKQTELSYYCSGAGYTASGSKGTTTITYGNENITKGILTSGDAFDCDVNGDGTYSPETERFYYVSDLYDTTKKGYNSEVAVLIYYNNISSVAYNSNNTNYNGPTSAKTKLPTTNQWNNVSLKNLKRQILNHLETTSTDGGNLPVYDYSGVASRLLTAQEINRACGFEIGSFKSDALDACNYLMENTVYSNGLLETGYWLETPDERDDNSVWFVNGYTRGVHSGYVGSKYGLRPAIEVKKIDIEY